jgi:hypothetical protein
VKVTDDAIMNRGHRQGTEPAGTVTADIQAAMHSFQAGFVKARVDRRISSYAAVLAHTTAAGFTAA